LDDLSMSSIDLPLSGLRSVAERAREAWRTVGTALARRLPKGLYARALIIIIAPMVILQSVVAFAFMERHWNTVTRRLSAAVTQDIAALIDIYQSYPHDPDHGTLRRIAQQRLGLTMDFLPPTQMPAPVPKPFFSLLDQTLSVELREK